MTDIDRTRNDPAGALWAELEAVEAGMLGISGSGQHMQPMAHFVDAAGRRLWFLTMRDTDLAQALHPESTAHFVIISENHDFYACMSGPIAEKEDAAIKEALWNSTAADHYADGKNDPSLMMIALDLSDAALWALSKGASHHRWQRGDAQDTDAETGVRNHVTFD